MKELEELKYNVNCDDGWDLADADVVCCQQCFSGAVKVFSEAYYGIYGESRRYTLRRSRMQWIRRRHLRVFVYIPT